VKAYLVTTGLIFGLMALLHVWKAVAEWPRDTVQVGFVLGMAALVVVPGAFAAWAWRLLRRSSPDQPRGNEKMQSKESGDSAG